MNRTVQEYLSEIGARGGSAKTSAQHATRAKNLEKARLKRWSSKKIIKGKGD
jgi:hypothetical protein